MIEDMNEDMFVTDIYVNRKVARFLADALERHWDDYTGDEINWDDLKHIFEHLKEYGASKLDFPLQEVDQP